jgi:hypothetical protein
MRLIVDWGVRSPRLDRLLAAGCSHCDGPVGRLVRHDARGGGTQVWVSCAGCCGRLGNALPHCEHPRLLSYPLWREDLGAEPTPEEIEEIVLATRPIALTELLAAIQLAPALARAHREFSADGLVVGYGIAEDDLAELAPLVGAGHYAVLQFEDRVARLLRFEEDLVRVLTPHRAGARLDLSDRSVLPLKWRPSP